LRECVGAHRLQPAEVSLRLMDGCRMKISSAFGIGIYKNYRRRSGIFAAGLLAAVVLASVSCTSKPRHAGIATAPTMKVIAPAPAPMRQASARIAAPHIEVEAASTIKADTRASEPRQTPQNAFIAESKVDQSGQRDSASAGASTAPKVQADDRIDRETKRQSSWGWLGLLGLLGLGGVFRLFSELRPGTVPARLADRHVRIYEVETDAAKSSGR
jgi:hypothetical protein